MVGEGFIIIGFVLETATTFFSLAGCEEDYRSFCWYTCVGSASSTYTVISVGGGATMGQNPPNLTGPGSRAEAQRGTRDRRRKPPRRPLVEGTCAVCSVTGPPHAITIQTHHNNMFSFIKCIMHPKMLRNTDKMH